MHFEDSRKKCGLKLLKNYKSSTTLVELLRWRAMHQSDRPAFVFLGDGEHESGRLTYGELDRQARATGAWLQDLGVTGERVLLFYPSGLNFITAFFGCLYAGAIAVPCFPPRPNRPAPRIQAISIDAQAKFALTITHITSNLKQRFDHAPHLKALQWLATDELPRGVEEVWEEPAITPDTLAYLQYTSGSTTVPKGAMVTHNNIMYNAHMLQAGFQTTEKSIVVNWLPLFHDMGLIGNVIHAVYLGALCILTSPESFLQRPARWLQLISHYKGTFSGAPNFAYDLCVEKISPEQRTTLDLSSWRTAYNGAEPLRPGTLKRFTETFAPYGFRPESFYPCYGLAEATLIVTGGLNSDPPVVRSFEKAALEDNLVVAGSPEENGTKTLVGCGQAILEEKIVIVDPKTLTRCRTYEIGEIWVSGENVAQGYWNRHEEIEQTFHAYLSDTGEGPFLRTGDLGFFHDGNLFIVGRSKDMIIIQGQNYYPQDIELTVEQSHPALRLNNGAVFSIDVDGKEQLVIVQEINRNQRNLDMEEVFNAIRWEVAKEHGLQAYALVLITPYSIPKTSSGKIMRYACRVAFLEGNLNVVGEWRSQV